MSVLTAWRGWNSRRFLGLIAGAVFLLVAGSAEARPYRLMWDTNADGVTAGYLVFYGSAPNTYQPVNGIDVGNINQFQVDLIPGQTYYFRVRAYDDSDVLGPPSAEMQFQVPLTPTVQLSTSSIGGGGTVTATILNGPGSRFDWVGFYPVTNSHSGFVGPFKYLNGGSTPPATGLTTAAVPFTAPTQPGQYNVRFFSNDSYNLLGTSPTLTVTSAASISASATGVMPGGAVTGTVSNGPGSRFDWVGLYPLGNSSSGHVDWKYLNGSQNPPAAGQSAANVSFTMPTTPGQYNLRFFANGTDQQIGTSQIINVASLTATPGTVAGGGTVTVTVTFGAGSRFDWVGLYPVANSASGYINWKYLNNQQSAPATGVTTAQVTFPMPAQPGQYNIRFFANGTYTPLGTSSTITVTSAASVTPNVTSVAPGGTVTVAMANGPGSRHDWIGLYQAGQGTSGYIDWKYLNGTQVAPATGVSNGNVVFTMPTMPGNYNFQLYSNGTYTQLAASVIVRVP